MTLAAGTRLGPYEITAKLGEGGMGEVWRATDSRLKRDVALKVLPPALAQDSERLQRFEREAQLLAALNHPHIAAIYGVEDSTPTKALVLELVEGVTLEDRLRAGALPLEESLRIAGQIAEALEAAHDRGIVHRDLKPANVKLTADDEVKVLDFGLAKALDPIASAGPTTSPTLMNSPTLTSVGTQLGVILGTAAYMSPEQARGGAVDKRADIWAFGALLYEMLTGRRLFAGETVSDTLAAVLRAEPDWSALPAATPPAVRRLLERCLERDRKRRLHDIGDARLELEDRASPAPAQAALRATLPGWIYAAGLGLLGLGALVGWALRPAPPAPQAPAAAIAAVIPPPPGTAFNIATLAPGNVALSRDGSRMTFAAEAADGKVRLWVRDIATGHQTELAGTEGAIYPFWSPDGRWIAYFVQGAAALRKIPAAGGSPLTLARAENGKGGTWNSTDDILFAAAPSSPISRVGAAGGTPVAVTKIDPQRFNSHRHPRFLGDGRRFLYLARAPEPANSTVMLASLDGGPEREVMRSPSQAEWDGKRLLFVRERTLMAQPFDAAAGTLTGEPRPVTDGVIAVPNAAIAMFSVSQTGLLAYHSGETEGRTALEWRDRSGASAGTLGEKAFYRSPALSPDGRLLAIARTDDPGTSEDLWSIDRETGRSTRLTLSPGEDLGPVWAPDGKSLIYCSNTRGPHALYRKDIAGAGEAELLYAAERGAFPNDISPDGRWVLFRLAPEAGNLDIMKLDLETRQASPWRATSAIEVLARFSPNGRWVTYASDESGRFEIYATPFPGPGRVFQISTNGGLLSYWRGDQREIVYVDLAGEVTGVEVESTADSLRVGASTPLFTAAAPTPFDAWMVPTARADRFLIVPTGVQAARNELDLLVNWTARLEAR